MNKYQFYCAERIKETFTEAMNLVALLKERQQILNRVINEPQMIFSYSEISVFALPELKYVS